jgi:hypothetical protein
MAATTAQPGSVSCAQSRNRHPAPTGDIAESPRGRFTGFPQLKLAHPRRIDQNALPRQDHQLSVGAGVPSPAIRDADVACGEQVVADEPIDDRRLSDARGSEARPLDAATF